MATKRSGSTQPCDCFCGDTHTKGASTEACDCNGTNVGAYRNCVYDLAPTTDHPWVDVIYGTGCNNYESIQMDSPFPIDATPELCAARCHARSGCVGFGTSVGLATTAAPPIVTALPAIADTSQCEGDPLKGSRNAGWGKKCWSIGCNLPGGATTLAECRSNCACSSKCVAGANGPQAQLCCKNCCSGGSCCNRCRDMCRSGCDQHFSKQAPSSSNPNCAWTTKADTFSAATDTSIGTSSAHRVPHRIANSCSARNKKSFKYTDLRTYVFRDYTGSDRTKHDYVVCRMTTIAPTPGVSVTASPTTTQMPGFVVVADGLNDCPPGYSSITDEAGCKAASAGIGLQFDAIRSEPNDTGSVCYRCGGCAGQGLKILYWGEARP
eukprot:gene57351-biopygen81126